METIIGIDLGTTNSCIAVWEIDDVQVVENENGSKTMPSVVAITTFGRKVGDSAKRQAAMYPQQTISSIKRLMGRTYDEIKDNIKDFSYPIVNADGKAAVRIDGETYFPEMISAAILIQLKKLAEDYLHKTVTDAVITVPAYFNENQRKATRYAGEIAHLNVRRIINEPTAAALAYNIGNDFKGNIAVFDLGGGTFDISILHCENGDHEVLSTSGDPRLGGEDFDSLIAERMTKSYLAQREEGYALDEIQKLRIREEAECAKKRLSYETDTEAAINFFDENTQYKHLRYYLSRDAFEDMIEEKIDHCIELCHDALEKAKYGDRAGLRITDIDKILLVGGSSRIPMVQRKVKEFFGKEPCFAKASDEVVAIGAAIQGAIINGAILDKVLLDVTPLSLGVMTSGSLYDEIIPANTTIPTSKKVLFKTKNQNQSGVEIIAAQSTDNIEEEPQRISYFQLPDIQHSSDGFSNIEVTFDLDINGILTIKATDIQSGVSKTTSVQNYGTLSTEQVESMRQLMMSAVVNERQQLWLTANPEIADSVTMAQSKGFLDGIVDDNKAEELSALVKTFESTSWNDQEKKRSLAHKIHEFVQAVLVQ